MRGARFLIWAAILTTTWGLPPKRDTSGETTWSIGVRADAPFIPCVFGCHKGEPCK